MYSPGQRVRRISTDEIGYIQRMTQHNGQILYEVGIGDATWYLPVADLEPAMTGFSALGAGARDVYPAETWLKREALRLLNAYRNDPRGALSNSRVEPQPHQLSVVLSTVEKIRPRMILADEVGLGKTIEAGLILKELRARGMLGRVLIMVPAGLVSQWVQELRSKFNEAFVVHDGGMLRILRERYAERNPWTVEPNVIASLSLARGDAHRELIAAADWDLVIVDEAHHARNWYDNGQARPNQAFELLEMMHDRVDGLLLLTATPMQLHEWELFSMISLVEPGLFRDFADFQSHRLVVAEINRHVAWLRDRREARRDADGLQTLLRRLGAPTAVLSAPIDTAPGRRAVAGWLEHQHRLSQVMLRNRKAHVGGFVTRSATRIPVDPTQAELALEWDTRAYIHRRHQRALRRGERLPAYAVTTFEKMLCSSSRALGRALEKRLLKLQGIEQKLDDLSDDPELLEQVEQLLLSGGGDLREEIAELEDLVTRAKAISDTKLVELERALRKLFASDPAEKVVIFTQFLATLELLAERLGRDFSVAVFHGGLKLAEKDAAVREFRDWAQILISSEAGGEGRNFQFCHILVNYDLPWNPMRIEQRIGRLDRVGQQRNVLVYNFQVKGTLDERILNVLEHRVRVFVESVGALEPILGEIEARLDEICLQEVEAAKRAIDRYEQDLEERLAAARRQEEQLRDLVMDARSLRRDAVDELMGRPALATPADLKRFVLTALARYPRAPFLDDGTSGVVQVEVPQALRQRVPRLEDSYRGSFDYKVALADERLEFFAFGHPLVEALAEETQRADFAPPPGAVLPSDGLAAGVVADYELRCVGVRDRVHTISHVVVDGEVQDLAALTPPTDLGIAVDVDPMGDTEVEHAELLSKTAAQQRLEEQFSAFMQENEALYQEELARLMKRYVFERRRHQERIERFEEQIRFQEFVGDSVETRRVVAGYRGAITQARRSLERIDPEEAEALAKLERLRKPTYALRVVGVGRITPGG